MQGSNEEKGFTILEAMVAFLILSVGMLGVGTLLTTSMSLDRRSTQERNAQYMAIDKIEYLRKLPRNTNNLLATTVTDSDELVNQAEDYQEYKDYGYWAAGYASFKAAHPEEKEENIIDPDMGKRSLFARRWTVSRLYWNDPVNGGEVDSGMLQVDIWVGWPVDTLKAKCNSDDPTQCHHFIGMTSFLRPLPPP
jgi:type II secretory pathway pseudopilin PulG